MRTIKLDRLIRLYANPVDKQYEPEMSPCYFVVDHITHYYPYLYPAAHDFKPPPKMTDVCLVSGITVTCVVDAEQLDSWMGTA